MPEQVFTSVGLFLTLAAFAGCAVVENPTPVETLDQGALKQQPRYLVAPGDTLDIRFSRTPEMNLELPVRPDGYLSLPMVGEIKAAGKTAEELKEELQQRYSATLAKPEITIIIRSFTGRRIHVGGKVDKPGVLPLTDSMTVLEAIFAAGGSLPEARLFEVVVIRRKPDNSYLVIPVNLELVLKGSDTKQNIVLLPYDMVYVPESPIGKVNTWVDLYIRRNIPINFGVRPSDVVF